MKLKDMLEDKSKYVLVEELKEKINNKILEIFKEIEYISKDEIKNIEHYPNTCFDYISNVVEKIEDYSKYLKKLVKDLQFLNSSECNRMSYEEFLEQEFLCEYNIRK